MTQGEPVTPPTIPPVAPTAPEPEVGDENPAGGAYRTQAEVDAAIKERLKRERAATATKYADYDDLKAKAAELDARKASEMTEAEQAKAEAEDLRAKLARKDAEIAGIRLDSLRSRLGTEYGLPEAIALVAPGTDEESLREWMEARAAELKLSPTPAPAGGAIGSPTAPQATPVGDLDVQIRQAYAKGDAVTAVALENRRHGI
jgi:hypothetical protein